MILQSLVIQTPQILLAMQNTNTDLTKIKISILPQTLFFPLLLLQFLLITMSNEGHSLKLMPELESLSIIYP